MVPPCLDKSFDVVDRERCCSVTMLAHIQSNRLLFIFADALSCPSFIPAARGGSTHKGKVTSFQPQPSGPSSMLLLPASTEMISLCPERHAMHLFSTTSSSRVHRSRPCSILCWWTRLVERVYLQLCFARGWGC